MMIIKSKRQSSIVPSAESESGEASREEGREGEGREVAVRVCLGRVWGSRRARVVLRVRRDRPVRWLARRLQDLFPAGGLDAADSVLVTSGCLLPPDEPLAILAPGDLVEVIPLHKDYGDEDEREFYKKFMSTFTGKLPVQQRCVRTEIQHWDETPVDLVPRSESDTTRPGHELDSSEELLHEMKRRALDLLDECSENSALSRAAGTEDRNKRRRRRVRRRRAPPPLPAAPCASPSPAPCPAPSPSPSPAPSPVLRNAGAAARSPRRVRAGAPAADASALRRAH